MIDDYFENLEKTVLDFKSIIKSYTIHHKELKTFPNHKHNISDEVCESPEPELYDILIEIQNSVNREQKKGKDG